MDDIYIYVCVCMSACIGGLKGSETILRNARGPITPPCKPKQCATVIGRTTHKKRPTSVSVTVKMGLQGSFALVLKGPEAKSSIRPLVCPWTRADVPVTRAIFVERGWVGREMCVLVCYWVGLVGAGWSIRFMTICFRGRVDPLMIRMPIGRPQCHKALPSIPAPSPRPRCRSNRSSARSSPAACVPP